MENITKEALVEELTRGEKRCNDRECQYDVPCTHVAIEDLLSALTRYGTAQRAEGASDEAYLWFNTWYDKTISNKREERDEPFGKWATERLQELGSLDTPTDTPLPDNHETV